ncbi:MAG: xanthine dehydrogenase family protein molybdopterin-binding subunit [Pseudomonadales bacterium]|nr:xanthine dehydrogenase family protein molybdopterin-binding subunit [Pseudomonadales bacterium]
MSDTHDYKQIGTRPIRPDGVDKITGRANYGADYSLPGMLHGVVLRSPYAHANIKRIDLGKALALEGVYAAVSGADFPDVAAGGMGGEGGGDFKDLASNIMARDKALYHGHAVAAVAATSRELAIEALDLIEVDYEVLTPVMNLDAAMAENAPLLNDKIYTMGVNPKPEQPSNVAARMEFKRGDIDAGFADAEVIVEGEFRTPTVHQGYIEPHACLATMNQGGQATLWCSTQGHFEVRTAVSKTLDMDVCDIKVIATEIGGGFGGKTVIYQEPVAILMSKISGRPVKMVMDREEVFRASGPASATLSKIKLGAKKDGTLTAMSCWMAYEAGAFPGSSMAPGAMCIFAPYKTDNFLIEGFDVVVNKPKVAAYRAPGAPQSMYACESLMDELAYKLEMDPIDLRLKNAVEKGDQAAYGPKFNEVGLRECLIAAKEHPNYSRELTETQGRGISVGFWFNAGMQSSAEVHINENGTVMVIEGNPDIGGSRASMALMAAETLGVPYEKVRVLVGDTETAGFTNVTGGSRTTFATGMAVIQASQDIISQAKQRAAKTWEIDEDQVDWQDGHAVPMPGVNADWEPLSLAKIAAKSGRTGGPLLGRASLNARGAGPGFSVNIAEVDVDPETGKTEVVGFTAIQDAGKAIHPAYVEGQLQGGAVQGIGWALNEEYVYDDKGVMQNPGFLDYRIPVASDLPKIDTVIIEVPNKAHPYGVRGVGETPIVAPLAAVANAVRSAIGIRVGELPLSPPRLLAAMDE